MLVWKREGKEKRMLQYVVSLLPDHFTRVYNLSSPVMFKSSSFAILNEGSA